MRFQILNTDQDGIDDSKPTSSNGTQVRFMILKDLQEIFKHGPTSNTKKAAKRRRAAPVCGHAGRLREAALSAGEHWAVSEGEAREGRGECRERDL